MLAPIFALVALTFVVWIALVTVRTVTPYRHRFNPQRLADEAQATVLQKNSANLSDNFENLFELPVLFYVACLIIQFSGQTDANYVALAWAFVVFRVLQSFVHCTYNRITHRFVIFILGSLALWMLWARLALRYFGG